MEPSSHNLKNLQMVPYGVDYQIPQADEDTHYAATTEQMDEEIEANTDVSAPQQTVQTPQRTPPIEQIEEEVDIDGEITPPLHDEYWEAAHPNSPLTTPLTTEPQSPQRTEEIPTGSEEQQPSHHIIPEEIPAAVADNIAHDDPDVDIINASPPHAYSIPSADTDTILTTIAEEVACALAVTDLNDSTWSP